MENPTVAVLEKLAHTLEAKILYLFEADLPRKFPGAGHNGYS